MVKKTKNKTTSKGTKAHKNRNVILGGVIVLLLVILFYVFSQQNSGAGTESSSEWSEEDYTEEMATSIGVDEETGMEIYGQSYFGYMKEDYILNVDIDGRTRRIQMKSLNEDETVDIVLHRTYNLEVGETAYSDYNNDGVAELSVTLDGVVLVDNRFSITITYFVPPNAITEKVPPIE